MFLRFSFLVVLCLFFSCNSEDTDKINIGFSQCISDDIWREEMNHSMQVEADLHPEVDLEIVISNRNVKKQIAQINKFVYDKVDIIIISPLESIEIVPAIENAYDSGIPVILIDRKINSDKYTAFLGADNLSIGRLTANYIASKTVKPIRVIELMPDDFSSPTLDRSLGFNQVAERSKNIKEVITLKPYTDGAYAQLLDSVSFEEVNSVFAFNDLIAKWAWSVADRKGIANNLKIVGVDGLLGPDQGIEMVLENKLKATILYPTGGAEAIKLALRIANGEQVPKNNELDIVLIDQLNADIMKHQLLKIKNQQADIENQIDAIEEQERLYSNQNNLLKITFCFLLLILGLAVYSIRSIFIIRKKNRQLLINNDKITIQRNQIEKIAKEVKESNDAKVNFFTGLSHEFKTPITLITTSLESLREMFGTKNSPIPFEISLIENNSRRLLRLVNNLLDFRKVEDQKFNLRVSKTNIYTFSNNIFKEFEREAIRRNIEFKLIAIATDLEIYFDRSLMDKVYFNLLSNAFKFTPDNGKITIELKELQNSIQIKFSDSGIGIPDKELDSVFKPFFKGSNNRKNSSGIGLFLSKQFVDLHLGEIEVQSVHGSTFIITLFKGNKHFNEDQITVEQDISDFTETTSSLSFDLFEQDLELTNSANSDKERYQILVIEDNKDLLQFLAKKLAQQFEIYTSDGTNAIEKATEEIPDIIICDINLPDKNGFEICATLKDNLTTSHIPIILLTANSDKESYLKGLDAKADLYITKPFSYDVLMQSIKSMLYNREKLRYYFTNNLFRENPTLQIKSPEQKFLIDINDIVKNSFENADFSVENLAESMGISRVQLYRKTKAILGYGVNDFINNFRLAKAQELLEKSNNNISEIAYQSGFSTPSYFSTAFKAKYGESPAAYRKNFKNQ
ncbi:substrate-binding domain-containing protein [Leeuwenhoekiella aequorea]|uniref:histidine kinase n=1 Tax=Leeuwenhoekiella aequorea TaxID=283736 RepID=A0A4Q0P5K8_9FLAO|nr:substrate-binding domain-containing protein [Leeuwenhoekiella aequorea]RXG21917.1 monosaccharide ABC transporter substrate-binding protein (CUT2 family) [Leeuwenhoekiella aequorea]